MRARNESGAVTVMVLALAVALVVIAGGAGSVVAAVIAHRTAQNAADLAALAGAREVSCETAADIARANRVELVECSIEGAVVTVEVVATTTFGISREMHARARAGPVTS